MTSFDPSPALGVWRALIALGVVFIMLATTGWTAVHHRRDGGAPLKVALTAWGEDRLEGRPLPDPLTAPDRLTRFFASLEPGQLTRLARRHPLVIGNMNGAPLALRYRANRTSLDAARRAESRRVHDDRLSPEGQRQAELRMQRYRALTRPDRQILAFDPTGSGRIAEVLGDLVRARRVSVVVPGVDTTLGSFESARRAHSTPLGMARALYRAERSASPATRTAVIAWADYTAPDGLGVEAATGIRARHGAVRLNAMLRGLPDRARVALYCHSYGSVLCGIAAPSLPSRVTDIAVAGSPGMRAGHASQLRTRARIWAMRDGDDWIEGVPHLEVGGIGHGADPVSPAFGARLLSANGANGHTGYFEPGTGSLSNLAEIGVGAYLGLECADGDDGCRSGLDSAGADQHA
ncbi:alpha/beta hydrolase [Streptomyces sp. NPDC049906]|uniref:alpha/beta hydrolase n=1 Tax=Streptomyces sp. NPDC049906 TaxID=3155656 RepID=UPI003422554A